VPTPLVGKGPEDIDFVVVRENTEGLYAGAGGTLKKGTPDEIAVQESINTRKGVELCLRYAFEYTRKRNKNKTLTLFGKTNVLTFAFDLWERAFHEVGEKDYADIKRDYAHVDATCMWMVKNPEWFDVIVTDNMFGDILSDAAAMATGSLGMLPSASLGGEDENGNRKALYEPVHGSAPDIAGQGAANPLATILSFAMMLRYSFDMGCDADLVEQAVQNVLNGGLRTADIMQEGKARVSTSVMGEAIVSELDKLAG